VKGPVLLIGAGRMGGALLTGWLGKNVGPLAVVEPSPTPNLRKQARTGGIALYSRVEAFRSRACACVVALKPQVLRREAASLKPLAQSGTLMISIAAGVTIETLAQDMGHGARIVRAMPNTPGAIGRGISVLYAPRGISLSDRRLAESLLSALGESLWVKEEALLNGVTAVSGSGPAYVFLLAEALAQAAEQEGLPKPAAERLARATVAGAGALLNFDRRGVAHLRADVTSPGGTTEAALKILQGPHGLAALIVRAVRAATQRAEELAE
jgi:pyrroline-5-carboxylate reductase